MDNLEKIVFAFVCGLYFAILQFAYFFLMEAFLSSQYLSYFVTLFFWLSGFLLGLSIGRDGWFTRLFLAGVATYYVAWGVTQWMPFSGLLYPAAACCSIVSGLLPGYFFPYMGRKFASIKSLFFHENNGFILGIFVSLEAAIYCGRYFLALGPLIGAALVVVVQVLSGATKEEPSGAAVPTAQAG